MQIDASMVKYLCSPPDILSAKRLLFIQPHPDDNQIGAGGTIAKLVSLGAEVWELTVMDDRETDLEYHGEGHTLRQSEALEAQKILGMKNAGFLGFADRSRDDVREISDRIVEVIRAIRPDAVITADPQMQNECHEDHIKVGNAVKTAFLDCEWDFYPEYVDNKPREDTCSPAMLGFYYTDRANVKVDITGFEAKKYEAIHAHASQKNEQIEMMLMLLDKLTAQGTDFESAEGLRMQSRIQSHCFNLPIE